MSSEQFTVRAETYVDADVYRDFSHFNSFIIRYRWMILLLFPILMTAFAFINLVTGSPALFKLFLAIGILAVPFYLIRYFISVKNQIKAFHLEEPKLFYYVTLSSKGVEVSNEKEQTRFKWNQVYRVYKREKYTYLYITKARGYIIPLDRITEGTKEQLDQIIRENLAPELYK